MKKLFPLLLCGLLIQIMACEDCEIVSTETTPPVPLVDCPALGLNIGDACDDGNADTLGDVVDENCNCVGEPVENCAGGILVCRAVAENNSLGVFFLDRSEKVAVDQLNFNTLTPISGSPIQIGEAFPFQFSTIDQSANRYLYGFQYGQNNILNPLLFTSLDGSFSPAFFTTPQSYAAPVVHQGVVYAIDVVSDGPTVQYTILQIDPSDGEITSLLMDNISVNSPMFNPTFFSVSNGTDKIFFVNSTNLIEYVPAQNSATYIELTPDFDPDMPNAFTGLEYRPASNELLALETQFSGPNRSTAFVTISLDGAYEVNSLLPFNDYALFSDGGILHSTAYSICDDSYYITTPFALEQENFQSYLIELEVAELSVNEAVFPDFLFGVVVDEP